MPFYYIKRSGNVSLLQIAFALSEAAAGQNLQILKYVAIPASFATPNSGNNKGGRARYIFDIFLYYDGQKLGIFVYFVRAQISCFLGICPSFHLPPLPTRLPSVEPSPSKPLRFVVFDSLLTNDCQ